jgi:uncharacterized protein (TIGR03382 family)
MRSFIACSLAAGLVAQVPDAAAFDWNGRTVTHEVDLLDGRMKVQSGHPLATARAFRLAAQDASALPALRRVLGADFVDDDSDSLQTVLFGSWLNEVRTNLDMGGSKPLEWAARYLEWRYRDYLEGRENSDRWQEDTGWTSSNYQHSMLVTSIDPAMQLTQDHSFGLIEEYTFWASTAAVMNLIIATKGAEEGSMSAEDVDLSRISGLRYVGSLFHIMEDSSVACTPVAQRHVPNCLPGDGHGLIERTRTGKLQVIALSSTGWYEREPERGPKPHGALDDLYRPELIGEVFAEIDPALTSSGILISVTRAVDQALTELADVPLYLADGSPNPMFDARAFMISAAAGRDIEERLIRPRYAAIEDRKPLPPIPGREDGWHGDDDDAAAGCAAGTGGAAAAPFALLVLGLVLSRRRRSRR